MVIQDRLINKACFILYIPAKFYNFKYLLISMLFIKYELAVFEKFKV